MTDDKPLRRRSANQTAKSTTWIYALSHPETGEVRYVGQTCRSVTYRLYEHVRAARNGENWPVNRWIRKLLAAGLMPVAREIEVVPPGASWQNAESEWIARYRVTSGGRLLNLSDGGDGARGVRHTSETRQKLSQIAKEQNRKPPGNKGRTFGPEARANMSVAHKGKPGKPWTPEQRANYLASRVYSPWTDELRERLMASRKGYMATAEHRKSLADASTRGWGLRKQGIFKSSEAERTARRLKRRKGKTQSQ